MRERVALTGCGLISSLGRSLDVFTERLLSGATGIAPVTAFDTSSCRSHLAGKLVDFDPAEYIDPGKLRRIDTVGSLAIASGKLALADAGIELKGPLASETGVVLGTYTAGLQSTVEFLTGFVRGGPAEVSPMIFSNTVGNAPASLCALELGLMGPNVTVTHKEASALAAVAYAVSLLRSSRASSLVTGGVDEVEPTFFRIHDRFRALSPQDGGKEGSRPFDRRRNGFVLGEGGVALVVETWARARERKARVYGEILGIGGTSSRCGINEWPSDPAHLSEAMRLALEDGGCALDEVGSVFASANGTRELDRVEAEAIRGLFGERAVPVVSVKGALGESSLSGAASLVAALSCLREQRIPPTVGLEELSPDCPVNASSEARPSRNSLALVNGFASGGTNYSILVRVGL